MTFDPRDLPPLFLYGVAIGLGLCAVSVAASLLLMRLADVWLR